MTTGRGDQAPGTTAQAGLERASAAAHRVGWGSATGTIRTTLAATPARWAVLVAKAAVVGAVTFPAGLVATALATLTSLAVVGLGAVLRSAAGTITTAVAVLFAPPILGALVSNELAATVLDHLPAGLSGALAVGIVTLRRRHP